MASVLDPVLNFVKVEVSTGYDIDDTSIVLKTDEGAKLPAPATDGEFNLVWWNSTDYPDPADDPNREIVRCTARSTDTLTVTRGQEGLAASTKNTADKVYKMLLALTKKTIDDIAGGLTVANEAADETCFIVFSAAATGLLAPKTNENLTFNSATGEIGASIYSGIAAGNLLDKSATETITGTWIFTKFAESSLIALESYSDVSGEYPGLLFRKSHQDTEGNTATISGELLGLIWFRGNSGSAFTSAAKIQVEQDGAAGTYTPSRILFFTSDGTSYSEKLKIDGAGVISVATGGSIVTADHGTATTDQVVNVCYGTGDPPTASTTTEGALYIKYTA
ncbi:MAG: hypothetical protein WC554_18105 [Clostridia bacterium]